MEQRERGAWSATMREGGNGEGGGGGGEGEGGGGEGEGGKGEAFVRHRH